MTPFLPPGESVPEIRRKRRRVYRCFECGLPDPYNGAGDGIGSCECLRCEDCGGPPGVCNCSDDYPYPDWPDDVDSVEVGG